MAFFCKHSDNVSRHDETPVKSTFLSHDENIMSHDMNFMSRENDIRFDFHTF